MSHAQELLNEVIDIREWKEIVKEDKKIIEKLRKFLTKKEVIQSAKTNNF